MCHNMNEDEGLPARNSRATQTSPPKPAGPNVKFKSEDKIQKWPLNFRETQISGV